MIEYVANQQTIHFVNWALHSGEIDVDNLEANAASYFGQKVYDEDPDEAIVEYLESEVVNEFERTLGVGGGGQVGDLPGYLDYASPASMKLSDWGGFFAPLLADALEKIDFHKATELILSQRCPA